MEVNSASLPLRDMHKCGLGQRQTQTAISGPHLEQTNKAAKEEEEQADRWVHWAAARVPCFGILLMVLACWVYATATLLIKLVVSVSPVQIGFFRCVFQAPFYGLMVLVRRLGFRARGGEWWPLVLRALFGAVSTLTHYLAIQMIPLGDAFAIRFSLSVWTMIIGYFLLKEPCSLVKIFAVVISVSGVVLIARPDACILLWHFISHSLNMEEESEFQLALEQYQSAHLRDPDVSTRIFGSLFSLTSSVSLALAMVFQRMCKSTPVEVSVFALACMILLASSGIQISLAKFCLPDNWLDVLLIVLISLLASLGNYLMASSLKVEQSGILSVARGSDVVIAFIYSAFLLHEDIKLTSIAGALLVGGSVISVLLSKILGERNSTE